MNHKVLFLGLLLLLFTSQAFAITDTNLIAYWKFDETSGTVLADSFNYDQNLDTTNVTINQTGLIGKSYLTTGYKDSGIGYIDSNITLSGWFKNNTSGGTKDIVIIPLTSNKYNQLQLTFVNSVNLVRVFTIAQGVSFRYDSGSINVGDFNSNWVYYSLKYDKTNNWVYWTLNNQSGNGSAGLLNGKMNRVNYRFGSSGQYHDEISLWNRILTGTDINQLYNSGNGVTYCGAGYDNNFMNVCSLTATDECERTLNQDWVVTTNIDCNSKTINLGTGKLVLSTGAKLRLYDSNLTCNRFDINASGSQLWLGSKSWIKTG